jgi:hypothetical protein
MDIIGWMDNRPRGGTGTSNAGLGHHQEGVKARENF